MATACRRLTKGVPLDQEVMIQIELAGDHGVAASMWGLSTADALRGSASAACVRMSSALSVPCRI